MMNMIVPTCLLLALSTVISNQNALAGKYKDAKLAGLTVTMTLEKRGPSLDRTDWPEGAIRLTAQTVTVVTGKTIHEILREAHIFPDVESFALVYELNPDISVLRDLKVSAIRIPKVSGGEKLETIFNQGFLVSLTLEKQKKEDFDDSVKALTLVRSTSTFRPEQFENATLQKSLIESLDRTTAILIRINQRIRQRIGRPITREALSQLQAEADLLMVLTRIKAANGTRFTKSEQDRIFMVEKDLRLKSRAFSEDAAGDAPDRYPEVKVIVKTLRDGNPISNLRIYYVPQALKGNDREVHSFGILSSPANKDLSEADYCFWAARDPSKTPVTNELCLEIRRNNFEVQLTVLH